LTSDTQVDVSKFILLRLNGVAGIGSFVGEYDMFNSSTNQPTLLDVISGKDRQIQFIIGYYKGLIDDNVDTNPISDLRLFNYSWEGSEDFTSKVHDKFKVLRRTAEEIMSQTEVLVIIGYSFPFFNKKVDTELFSKFQYGKIRKIYLQDCNERIDRKFRSLFGELIRKNQIEVAYQPDIEQFVLPDEL
jgi:hypothetical protein